MLTCAGRWCRKKVSFMAKKPVVFCVMFHFLWRMWAVTWQKTLKIKEERFCASKRIFPFLKLCPFILHEFQNKRLFGKGVTVFKKILNNFLFNVLSVLEIIYLHKVWPTTVRQNLSYRAIAFWTTRFLRPVYTKPQWLIWSISIKVCIISHQLGLQTISAATHFP